MGVYTRFKKAPGGFRNLVELLESTPKARRDKMISVGMAEDPEYTMKALKYTMSFKDLLDFPDLELAELLAKAPPRMTAYAILGMEEAVIERFLRNCKPPVGAEIKDYLDVEIGPREKGAAQLKLVETARALERVGKLRTKRIPLNES